MWPFTSKPDSAQLPQDLAVAIGDTLRDNSAIARLFPDNATSMRFIFSSYVQGMIFHGFSQRLIKPGTDKTPDIFGIAKMFPDSDKAVSVGKLIVNPKELWHLPEFLDAIAGGEKPYPKQCKDLNLSMHLLIISTYFMRWAEFEKGIEEQSGGAASLIHPVYIVSGVQLSLNIFDDDFPVAETAAERSSQLIDYSHQLYEAVLAVTKKYS